MTIYAADLFCGAGGSSTGLARACAEADERLELLAVNHWEVAVETHARNHPWADHRCATLDSLEPRKAVPRGKLDLLIASPECTHHSIARGGRPVNDQSRASAWHVVRWAEALLPRVVLVENVREFRTWGPIGADGRPLPSRKGETFDAWCAALRSLGYRVESRILCAADYGDPTTRERLFVAAVRGRGPIRWPAPTHARNGAADLFGARRPWRTAREIIDWSLRGASIFDRKRPLVEATLRRIAEGLRRFGGTAAEPFLAVLRGTGTVRDLNRPVPALTAGGEHLGLVEPFILGQQSCSAPRVVSDPVPTVAAAGAISLVHPFLVRYQGTGGAESVADPVSTVTTRDRLGLVEPASRFDILFRMLAPHELARAQGFPDEYQFAGTRTDAIRQIGNAVPVGTAQALCSALVERLTPLLGSARR